MCLFMYFIIHLMYVNYNYFIYQFMLMCFLVYFILYSSYSNSITAHGVDKKVV